MRIADLFTQKKGTPTDEYRDPRQQPSHTFIGSSLQKMLGRTIKVTLSESATTWRVYDVYIQLFPEDDIELLCHVLRAPVEKVLRALLLEIGLERWITGTVNVHTERDALVKGDWLTFEAIYEW